jgi:hypothetical protein
MARSRVNFTFKFLVLLRHAQLCSQNGGDRCNMTENNFQFTQVKSGWLNKIIHRFPEAGHSFMPCDRVFGEIEKKNVS